MAAATPADDTVPDTSGSTYQYLRVILPLPASWLLLAIFLVFAFRGEVLDSISDYYGGPLRDVFVGALMASGACMISYKGESKLEDYALNFAGVNAFFVALVPNSFQDQLDTARQVEAQISTTSTFVPSSQLLQNLHLSVAAFLVVCLAFVIFDRFVVGWTRLKWQELTKVARGLTVASWALEIVLLGIVVSMVGGLERLFGASIFSIIHFTAAGLLIINLSFAAASHAFPQQVTGVASTNSRATHGFFTAVTVLMWIGVAVGGLLIALGVPYATISTEVVEIVLFIAFWTIATREVWGPLSQRLRRRRSPA